MITAAQIQTVVTADTRQHDTAMRESAHQVQGYGDAADKANSKGSGFFSGVLGGAAKLGLAVTGVGALTGAVTGLASGMVSGNAEFERYETQFGVLLGSAEAAKARLGELAEFGAKTPFELPQVVRADKILQGFGLHSEQAAKKFGFSGEEIRTIAGDLAAGTGADFEMMSTLIGKFASGATGEAISRFQELGITTREELAGLGLEFSKSGQLMSPLPEALNTVLKVAQDKFGGMMDAQSSTFEGMVSNLQDWMGATKRTIMQPIFEVLREKLGDLLGFLNQESTQKAITGFANLIASGIGGAIDTVSKIVSTGKDVIGAFRGVMDAKDAGGLKDAVEDLPGPLQQVVTLMGTGAGVIRDQFLPAAKDAFGNAKDYILGVVETGDLMNDAVAKLPQPLQDAARAAEEFLAPFGGLGGIVTSVQEFVGGLLPMVEETLGQLGPVVGDLLGTAVEMGRERLAVIIDIVMEIWGIISGFFQENGEDIIQTIMGWAERIGPIIQSGMEVMQTIVMTVLGIVRDFMRDHGDEIQAILTKAWETIKIVIDGAMTVIENVILPAFKAIADFISENQETIKGVIDGVWTVISSIVRGAMDVIQGIIKTVTSVISGDWKGAWEGIKQIFSGIWGAFEGIVDGTLKALGSLIDLGMKAVQGVWEGAWNNIQNFFTGAWKFVTEEVPKKLAEVVTNIATWAVETAKSIPDKVLGIGKSVIDGIRDGISNAWEGLVTWVTGKFQELWDNITGIFQPGSPSKVAIILGTQVVQGMFVGVDVGLRKYAPGIIGKFGGLLDGIRETMVGQPGSLTDALNSSVFKDAIQPTGDSPFKQVAEDMVQVSAAIVDDAVPAFQKLEGAVRDTGDTMAEDMRALVDKNDPDSIVGQLNGGFDKTFQHVKDAWGPQMTLELKRLFGIWRGLFRDFVDDVKDMWLELPSAPTPDGTTTPEPGRPPTPVFPWNPKFSKPGGTGDVPGGTNGNQYVNCNFVEQVVITDPDIQRLLERIAQYLPAHNGATASP